jgi:hypothetical protein
MGACRETKPMERILDRFLSQLRSVDKILWLYSGRDTEREEYPLSSFLSIEEELDEAHRLWMDLMEAKRNERDKVVKLNNKKHPIKEVIPKKVTYEDDEDFLDDIYLKSKYTH